MWSNQEGCPLDESISDGSFEVLIEELVQSWETKRVKQASTLTWSLVEESGCLGWTDGCLVTVFRGQSQPALAESLVILLLPNPSVFSQNSGRSVLFTIPPFQACTILQHTSLSWHILNMGQVHKSTLPYFRTNRRSGAQPTCVYKPIIAWPPSSLFRNHNRKNHHL